jgi:plastocyanin
MTRRSQLSVAAVLLSASSLFAACGGGSDTASPTTESAGGTSSGAPVVVVVKGLKFDPSPASAEVGQTVEWRFQDGAIAHNVVGDGWKSESLATGTYEHAFDEAGTHKYTCTLHPGMNGEVEVR